MACRFADVFRSQSEPDADHCHGDGERGRSGPYRRLLEIGADDYIPKPFNPRELLARIRAVLRRQANELPGAPSQEEAVIAFGKFKLNLGTREMFREDEPMPLTSGEFAVLKALVSHHVSRSPR